MKREEDQTSDNSSTDIQNNTKTSQEDDLIVTNDKKYTEQEVEQEIAKAVNEALSSEFMNMLKNDSGFQNKVLRDSLLSFTSFKDLGYVKAFLLSVISYSGILALYTLITNQLIFFPKGSILILGLILALVDKTIRPLVLIIEKTIRFKTSGYFLIFVYTAVIYYVSVVLNNEFSIKVLFSSVYELYLISILVLLCTSILDYVVMNSKANKRRQKLLLGSEKNE